MSENYVDSIKHKGKLYKYKDWDLIHPDEENVGKVLSVTLDSEGNPVTTWTNAGKADIEDLSELFEKYTKNTYKQVGTAVPNAGTVSTLYVSKDFSYEKCLEYFDRLTFTHTADGNYYPIITSANNELILSFVILGGAKFIIVWDELAYQTDVEGKNGAATEFGLQFLTFIQPDGRIDLPEEIQLSDKFTASSHQSGDTVYTEIASGDQNDLITDLVSIAPYENVLIDSQTYDCAKYSIRDKEGNDIVDTYQTKKDANKFLEFNMNSIRNGVLINKDTFNALKNREFKYILTTDEADGSKAQCYYFLESYYHVKNDESSLDMEVLLFSSREFELLDRKNTITEMSVMYSNIDGLGAILYSGKTELMIVDALRIVMSDGRELSKRFDGNNYYYEFPNAGDNLNSDVHAYPTAQQVKNYIENNSSVYDINFNNITTNGLSVSDDIHEKIINGQITTIRLRKTVTDSGAFDGVFDFELKRSTDLVKNTSGTSSPSRYITFTGLNDSLPQYIFTGCVSLVTIIYDKDNKKFIIHPLFSLVGDSDAEIQMLTTALRAKGNNDGDVIGNITLNDGIVLSLNVDTTEDLSNDSYLVDSKAVKNYVGGKIADLVDSAPETMDTIGELATALKENQDVVETINNAITDKANKKDLSPVATSGSYNDLINTPDFTTVEQVEELIANSGSSGSGNGIELSEYNPGFEFTRSGANIKKTINLFGSGYTAAAIRDNNDYYYNIGQISHIYIEEWIDGQLYGSSPLYLYNYNTDSGKYEIIHSVEPENIGYYIKNPGSSYSSTTTYWIPFTGTLSFESLKESGGNYLQIIYFDIDNNKSYWREKFDSSITEVTKFNSATIINEHLGDTIDPSVYKGTGHFIVVKKKSSPINANKIIVDENGNEYKLISNAEYNAIMDALLDLFDRVSTLEGN